MASLKRLRTCIAASAAIFALSSAPSAFAKVHLKIAATSVAMDAFQNWTSGIPWEQIEHYKNRNAIRPAVDLVLELQALKASGLDFDFELVRTLTYDLAKTAVVDGQTDLSAETIWDSEIVVHAAKLLHTAPVIRDGEFVKGIYGLPTNEKLLAVKTADDLRAFTGAVVPTWTVDAKTVEAMNLKAVITKATPEMIFQAIQKQQADFILTEFSATPDLSTELAGVRLVPVQGYKVAISGSRSWIVSKKSVNAEMLHQALEAGLQKLHAAGVITRAYQECGFINTRVSDWKRLF